MLWMWWFMGRKNNNCSIQSGTAMWSEVYCVYVQLISFRQITHEAIDTGDGIIVAGMQEQEVLMHTEKLTHIY